MTIRAQHMTDIELSPRQRRRTISQWLNYWNHQAGRFDPVDLAVEDDQTVPPDWDSPFHFRYQVKRANLQIYAHDLSAPTSAAVVGLRQSANPSHWMVIKALGVNTGSHVVDGARKAIRWPNAWPNAHLNYQATRAGLRKRIDLLAPGHPMFFEFRLTMPAAANIRGDGRGGLFIVAGGQDRLHVCAPYGWDSSENAELRRNIRVSGAVQSNTVNGNRRVVVLRLTPNPSDLASASYPVYLDPTTTISGSADINDALLYSATPGSNYGTLTSLFCSGLGTDVTASVLSFNKTLIPAGILSGFRFNFDRFAHGSSQNQDSADCYMIKTANNWTEGGVCWSYTQGTTPWAGSGGCHTSGTDYYADASPPTLAYEAYTSGGALPMQIDLDPQWVTDWRDSVRENRGFLLRGRSDAPNTVLSLGSSDSGGNPCTFEIDWSPPPSGSAIAGMTPWRITE